MRVPLEWLKEFVPVKLKADALAERLTMAGMEVIGLESVEGQPVLDIEITPNRSDWLSIIGVAREVALVTGARLNLPNAKPAPKPAAARKPAPVSLLIEDPKGCPYYLGRVLTGVRLAASPAWMQQRLLACGIRPINNVVDITNYVLLEMGQPLHTFDLATLQGSTIRVRRAAPREPLLTLEGKTHALTAEMLVIADAAKPVAIAGVMGGQASAVSDGTQAVLLESALFEPRTVRRTARALGLQTESSYRFERGVDPAGVARASERAAALICELTQAQEIAVVAAGRLSTKRATVSLKSQAIERRLGITPSDAVLRTTLATLGCRVASRGRGTLRVTPPSFRQDLWQEVDLIEEVARAQGYDRLPATLPVVPLAASPAPGAHHHTQALRQHAIACGLTEIVTWSLLSIESLQRGGQEVALAPRLRNPLSLDHAYLRPSLLPGMLSAVRHNIAQGAAGLSLFELGHVFHAASGGRVEETTALGLLVWGLWSQDWQARVPADFFRLKGLVAALAGTSLQWQAISLPWTAVGQSAEVHRAGQRLGVAGQVSAAVLAAWDIETPVWFAELDVAALDHNRRGSAGVQAPTVMPPVKRDISFLVSAQTPYAAIAHVMRTAGHPLAARIELIDRYAGKQVPAGQSSLTFAIEYRDPARTLTAAEADAVHQRLGQALSTQLGAVLR